jgi:small nuclear ribonucleoprotein (snRNP)-like protein
MFASWRRVALHRRVLVNLKTDKALRGVLFDQRGDVLVLKDTVLLEPNADPVRIDGDVVVERANIDFVQIVAGVEA